MNKVPTVKKVKLDESKYSIKCPEIKLVKDSVLDVKEETNLKGESN